MFEHFADYLYSLLIAPLKKGIAATNQFYIFFTVIGRLFDKAKQNSFRARDEMMLIASSGSMLQVHGQDRAMPRLKGETLENYRERLLLKGIIAEAAGSNEGILYVAQAFGYDNVEIVPGQKTEHWAEATVQFIGGKIVLDDQKLLLQELDKIKPARTLLTVAKEQRLPGPAYIGTAYIIGKHITIRQG